MLLFAGQMSVTKCFENFNFLVQYADQSFMFLLSVELRELQAEAPFLANWALIS